MSENGRGTKFIPWWLWPNVLNFDAPVVAVAWQELFARGVGVELVWPQRWLLFLAVWGVYFADRWLDARIGRHESAERHLFHRRIGGVGWAVLAAVCVTGLGLAFQCLNREGWIAAGVVGGATGIWFALTHVNGAQTGWLPKELGVGVVFAAGAALQPWVLTGPPKAGLLLGAGMFATVCVQNCVSITVWERLPTDKGNPGSILNQWPGWSRHVRRVSLGLAMVLALIAVLHSDEALRRIPICAAVSLLALGALGLGRPESRRRETRMLADLALLTPLFVVFQ